jgi:hypothetical protein
LSSSVLNSVKKFSLNNGVLYSALGHSLIKVFKVPKPESTVSIIESGLRGFLCISIVVNGGSGSLC